MSHTSKTLKNIAASEDYQALVSATEQGDYQTLYQSYMKVDGLIKEAEKQIQEKIENLPRQNKDDERQKFQSAFASRSKTALPEWYRIKSEMQKQKIMECMVVSIGKKGDPMARTAEGRIVIVSGSQAKEGDKLTLKVVSESEKVDFGRPFEFTPDSFYFLLNYEVYQQMRDSLDSVQKQVETYQGAGEDSQLSLLSNILKQLEEVRELIPRLQESDKEWVVNRIAAYRRRLFNSVTEKLVSDFIDADEEREIKDLCSGDEAQISCALAAPGLFHSRSLEILRDGLFNEGELQGYTAVLSKMENGLDSMNSAMELIEFKAGIDKLVPKAKLHLEKMERLFQLIQVKARQLSFTLANDTVSDNGEILARIKEAFNDKVLGNELRRVFRTSGEFFDSRGAVIELKAKLGDAQSIAAEAAIKPYLLQKINRALG